VPAVRSSGLPTIVWTGSLLPRRPARSLPASSPLTGAAGTPSTRARCCSRESQPEHRLSGTWLATYEYLVDDVNKWWFLARSGRIAGATSLATHGDLSRSPGISHQPYGIGDELRVSFVTGGTYWAAAGLLRDASERWFTEDDVRCLASLSEPIADGFRRALLVTAPGPVDSPADGPGVIVFDRDGNPESLSPGAEHWIGQMVDIPRRPPQRSPRSSKRSPPGPAAPTPARTRCRSARGPEYGQEQARGCCSTALGWRADRMPVQAPDTS
jgi:hypothetical protein